MHHSDFIVVEKRLAKTQKELAARDRRIAELETENERLRAAIEKAPHHIHCRCQWLYNAGACNCWKRAALAGKEQENASSQT